MTIEELQKRLCEMNVSAKILYLKKTEFGDYEIVYTNDLSYVPEETFPREYIFADTEKDILAADYEEAIEFIKNPVKTWRNN